MKFSISKEHKDFFQKEGCIEFESLFTQQQLEQLQSEMQRVIAARLQTTIPDLRKQNVKNLFQQGHDLWRSSELIRKFVTQTLLIDILAELLDPRSLRLGWDQLIPWNLTSGFENDPFGQLLSSQPSLKQIGSVQGLECGIMLPLPSTLQHEEVQSEESPPSVFSRKLGNAVFFNAQLPIRFSEIKDLNKANFFLITYAESLSTYSIQDNDPHAYALKQIGYASGERLNDKWNPIVFRR